jgi:mono/diheme cytochrome c family protein
MTGAALALLLCLLAPQSPETAPINRRDEAVDAYRATGRSLYTQYCAHCHGDDAKGRGRLWTSELEPAPPDLTAVGMDAAQLAEAIKVGTAKRGKSPLCPPWERTIRGVDLDRLSLYLALVGGKTSAPAGPDPAAAAGTGEPFPWFLLLVILVGVVGLWRFRPASSVGAAVPPPPTPDPSPGPPPADGAEPAAPQAG